MSERAIRTTGKDRRVILPGTKEYAEAQKASTKDQAPQKTSGDTAKKK